MAGKAQQEYLQERALQLKAAAEQEAFRPKKSLIQTHKEDLRSLTLHACLLALLLLGAPLHLCCIIQVCSDYKTFAAIQAV